jgi:HAD superfamily hydrolase (TIGR01549 family)
MFGVLTYIKDRLSALKNNITNEKSPNLQDISVIIWDFDGTLYQSDELYLIYHDAYFAYIQNKLGKHYTIQQFKEHANLHGTWSKAAATILHIEENVVNNEVSSTVKKVDHLQPNQEIVSLLSALHNFQHVILTNSPKKEVVAGLKKIGFKKNKNNIYPFTMIFSADGGYLKPDPQAFKQVLEFTKLPPRKHLMIGDSIYSDIIPARKLGLQALDVAEALPLLYKAS